MNTEGWAFQNSLLFQIYFRIAKSNPEIPNAILVFPCNALHLHLRITKKKHHSLKNQGGPHSTLSLILHWKSTIYHFITQAIHFSNTEQQIF